MTGFGCGDAHPGKWIEDIVRTLEKMHNDSEEVLPALEEAVTACTEWGLALSELFKPDTISILSHVTQYRQALLGGKAVISYVRLPGGGVHMFTIEPLGNGQARVLHAWPNQHPLRAETPMSIDAVSDLIEQLPELDCGKQSDLVKLRENLRLLWGPDHANEVAEKATSATARPSMISFLSIESGVPEKSMNTELDEELGRLTEHSARAMVFTESPIVYERRDASGNVKAELPISLNEVFWACLGFVFSTGDVLIYSVSDDDDVDFSDVVKQGVARVAGRGAGFAVAQAVTPGIARIGVSVVRANALAGVVMFGVFVIWDVVEWKMDKITGVELRKRVAAGAGGAGFGIAGGIAAGAAGGIWFGPIGAFVGGGIGALVGGFGGGFAGQGIDWAIWDQNEDAVMTSYAFFDWRDVDRNTHTIKSAEDMGNAYAQALKKKPKKVEEEPWAQNCVAHMMVLLPAMYPEFTVIMRLANKLREMKNKLGISVAATTMYGLFDKA